jgi:hypothetical protein
LPARAYSELFRLLLLSPQRQSTDRLSIKSHLAATDIGLRFRLDGHEFYFRSRFDRWTLYIVKEIGELWGKGATGWMTSEPWGDGEFAASYMEANEVRRIVREQAERFHRGALELLQPPDLA